MVALYTVVVGVVTVGGVYLLFHSGLYILVVVAAGMVSIAVGSVLVGGTGATTLGGVGASFDEAIETSVFDQMVGGNTSGGPSAVAVRVPLVLILYGVGLVFWSIVALAFFGSGLQ
jgi:hypothetical protein